MTRITVVGATGKVGQEVIALLDSSPSDEVAGAIVSEQSDSLGKTIGEVSVCVPAKSTNLLGGDVVIDFSTPAGSMNLLDELAGSDMPVVIATTGFNAEQTDRLRAEGTRRPILIGANFTFGFEAFANAALSLAANIPEAEITVGEIYNAKKKPAASGTTQRLCADIRNVFGDGKQIHQDIQRIGDTAGVNTVSLDLGFANIELKLTVNSRQAYAAGSIQAASWLLSKPNGVYAPSDLLD